MYRLPTILLAILTASGCSSKDEKSDLDRFRDSINYIQSSIALEPSGTPLGSMTIKQFDKIAKFRRLALFEAEAIDPRALARIHDDMPDHFTSEYLPGLRLWLEGYDTDDMSKINQARPLTNAWGDWYRTIRAEIMAH